MKMVKEEIDVGKADKGNTVVSKVNQNDDEEILDDELEHVLCRLFYPTSDERSSKMRKVFLQNDIRVWDEFMAYNKQEFQTYGFSPSQLRMLHQLLEFIADLVGEGKSTENPCEWTYKMWNDWKRKQQ